MPGGGAFERLRPGEAVPPPPRELTEWARESALATLAGMLYGSGRAYSCREPPSLDVHPQVTLQRNLIRAARGAALGGLQMGSFAALFLGAQAYLACQRNAGSVSWADTALAGGGTAALFGTLMPRGVSARAKGLTLGLALGAGLGAPLGVLQEWLAAQARLLESHTAMHEASPAVPSGAATATIGVLQASLGDTSPAPATARDT